MRVARTLRRATLGTAVTAVLVLVGLSKTALAEVRIHGFAVGRFGLLGTWGMSPGLASDWPLVGGMYGITMEGRVDAGAGYVGAFRCHSAANTANGAGAAWGDGDALPVTHTWGGAFAGRENFAANTSGGGFGSFLGGGRLLCNDEVYVTLESPYGSLSVGEIVNPLRGIFDYSTRDPYFANQHAFYTTSDYRGNALRYFLALDEFTLTAQLDLHSGARSKTAPHEGAIVTALLTYSPGAVMFGFAAGVGDTGPQRGNIPDTEGPLAYGGGLGGFVSARLGRTEVALSAFQARLRGASDDGLTSRDARVVTDLRARVEVGLAPLRLIAIGGLELERGDWRDVGAGDVAYHFVAADTTVPRIEMARLDLDLWLQLELDEHVRTYLRSHTITRSYETPDAVVSARATATLAELGLHVTF